MEEEEGTAERDRSTDRPAPLLRGCAFPVGCSGRLHSFALEILALPPLYIYLTASAEISGTVRATRAVRVSAPAAPPAFGTKRARRSLFLATEGIAFHPSLMSNYTTVSSREASAAARNVFSVSFLSYISLSPIAYPFPFKRAEGADHEGQTSPRSAGAHPLRPKVQKVQAAD